MHKFISFFNNTRCLVAGIIITVFLIYYYSLCPTVYLIDSGELAAVSYTLGIAHPTGYPLYTLISHFFAHLPGEPIKNLNILSALFSTTAAVFLYLTAKQVLKDKITPLLSVSLFAFSLTMWRTSVTNEVYPLTALFAVLIIHSLFMLRNSKGYYLIMYLIGLSLTNHIIIFSLAIPVFCYIIFVYRPSVKRIMFGLLCALLGVSLYLYLITRTAGGAELAWGSTYNLHRLIWHVTGKQYQVWMFTLSLRETFNNLFNGFTILLKDFLFIFVIPVFFGFYHLYRVERKYFWLLISIFLLNLLYAVNYPIPDIESYYIPGFIALILILTYGLALIKKYLQWFIVLPIAVIIPIVNYNQCTLKDNTFGLDFGEAHLEQLPQNSLLVCSYWDIYSPTIYLRKVKGMRRDLVIIDKELLRRTWYIKYIEEEYPEFYQMVENAVEAYLIELYKFEYDRPYDSYTIQLRFIRMLESFVDAKVADGVYFALPFPDHDLKQVYPHYYRIPRGLVFEIKTDTTNYIPFDFSKLSIRKPIIINDERLRYNIELIKGMAENNHRYLNLTKRYREKQQVKDWLTHFP